MTDSQAVYVSDMLTTGLMGAENCELRLGDTVEQTLGLTHGDGIDASIEALGSTKTFDAAFRVLNPRGRLSNVGYHESKDALPIDVDAFGLGHGDQKICGGLCPGGSE
ncbi:zinc-binding dehydrogenase [Paenarthrobacter sp. NPDC091669]|uniref:zinc-binding dehydrogenase n=1 Tax=Paenarthrobacter sp. NPDC091669 TaxID=3364384 RepID=UPI003814AC4E